MRKHILAVTMGVLALAAVTQSVSAVPNGDVPEVASTSLLMGIGFVGVAVVRRFLRR